MEQKKNDFQWRTVKKVLRYIGRFRLYLMASLLFAFLTVVLTLLAPRLTGAVVDHMIGAGRVDFPGVRRIMLQLILAAAGVGIFQWCMNLFCSRVISQSTAIFCSARSRRFAASRPA